VPGLIFLFHTRSISPGRKRRTGAGLPWRWTWSKNSSWRVGWNRISSMSTSTGWLMAKARRNCPQGCFFASSSLARVTADMAFGQPT
jgi:hypothetical protein